MLLDLTAPGYVLVRKEVTDPVFGNRESRFFYHVKKALQAKGFSCVKKLAYKDGHLVDNNMYYIRDKRDRWHIWDADHAVRCVSQVFDTTGCVKIHCWSDTGEGLVK